MTGFGVGAAVLGSGRVLLELRSLNHRFLDVRIRTPSDLSEHAFFLEQQCRELLSRGRFEVAVRTEGSALPAPSVDLSRARSAYKALCALRDEVAPTAEVPISAVAAIPDVMNTSLASDPEPIRLALKTSLKDAVAKLDVMRLSEGKALEAELKKRLDRARAYRTAIAGRAPALSDNYRRRLEERIAKLVADSQADIAPGRLEHEVALMAEKADIAEELARLSIHFDQFEQLMAEGGSVGRRLDFLLQEIGRETNTIGAKCQDPQLSSTVIELKAEVERLREQVQNVE